MKRNTRESKITLTMGGKKNFVNKTKENLSVTLIIREGSDPSNTAGTLNFLLEGGQSRAIVYGTDTDSPFLNGMTLSWNSGGASKSQTELVTIRGSAWDDTLNINSTVTISSVSGLQVSGTN